MEYQKHLYRMQNDRIYLDTILRVTV